MKSFGKGPHFDLSKTPPTNCFTAFGMFRGERGALQLYRLLTWLKISQLEVSPGCFRNTLSSDRFSLMFHRLYCFCLEKISENLLRFKDRARVIFDNSLIYYEQSDKKLTLDMCDARPQQKVSLSEWGAAPC